MQPGGVLCKRQFAGRATHAELEYERGDLGEAFGESRPLGLDAKF